MEKDIAGAPLVSVSKGDTDLENANSDLTVASTLSVRKSNVEINVTTDACMYNMSVLETWEAFNMESNSVWSSWELWGMMLRLGGVGLAMCICTLLVVSDPAALRISRFTDVSKFLNVLVGLLLSFFLSSSMLRWHDCMDGFMELMDAIRSLQMQLAALGVKREEATLVTRFGLASAWLLYRDLMLQWKHVAGEEGKRIDEEMWKRIREKKVNLDGSGLLKLLTDDEILVVRPTRDPSGMMWMWIGALVGKLAQDGHIPGMATPTYGRIMNLCQDGHGGIRDVRASITVQAPLPYTQTLSILVHINGLLNAVTMGLVCGIALGTFLVRRNLHIYENKASGNETTQDFQAQPFEYEDTTMPMDRLLHNLEQDLKNGCDLWLHLPPDARPCFRTIK